MINKTNKPPLKQLICPKCVNMSFNLIGFYDYGKATEVIACCNSCGRTMEINLRDDDKKRITIKKKFNKDYLG